MKVRESGMPDEILWESFFNTEIALSELEVSPEIKELVEIGCGYGIFTLPAARRIKGTIYAFDIEEEMIDVVRNKAEKEELTNVKPEKRDILRDSTGMAANSVDYVMLYNILHHENPHEFLEEAYRILKPGGSIGIMHWRSDIPTPRGPKLAIRPKPDEIVEWIDSRMFTVVKGPVVIEPFHFGLVVEKNKQTL